VDELNDDDLGAVMCMTLGHQFNLWFWS